MRPITDEQVRTLLFMASPAGFAAGPKRDFAGLEKRGLVTAAELGRGVYRITAAGLRTLADEMDSGRVKRLIDAIIAERAAQRAAAA